MLPSHVVQSASPALRPETLDFPIYNRPEYIKLEIKMAKMSERQV